MYYLPDNIIVVDSPVKRVPQAEPRTVEPSFHRQNLVALRDQLAALLSNKVPNVTIPLRSLEEIKVQQYQSSLDPETLGHISRLGRFLPSHVIIFSPRIFFS